MISESIIAIIDSLFPDNTEKVVTPSRLRYVTKTLANSAKVYEVGEMQVFKRKLPEDEDYEEGRQIGDYCIGIVENNFIQGVYVGPGDGLSSYELETSINL